MPLDIPFAQTLPVDAAELHGVPRHVLVRHAMRHVPLSVIPIDVRLAWRLSTPVTPVREAA